MGDYDGSVVGPDFDTRYSLQLRTVMSIVANVSSIISKKALPNSSCRTSEITDDCWTAMARSCTEGGGTTCKRCLSDPVTDGKTADAGCPKNLLAKVADCF